METFLFRRLIPLSLGGLLFSRARFCFTGRRDSLRRGLICQGRFFPRRNQRCPGRLAFGLALLAGGFQFAVPRGENFRLASGQFVRRGDVADGAVQTPGVGGNLGQRGAVLLSAGRRGGQRGQGVCGGQREQHDSHWHKEHLPGCAQD